MGNLGLQEVLIIAVIALIVVGPERLPDLARQAGKLVAKVRRETSSSVAELKRAAEIEDLDRELRGIKRDLTDIRKSVTGQLFGEERPASNAPPPTDDEAT